MNVNTGELFRVESSEALEQLRKEQGEYIQKVTKEHEDEANKALGDKDYAQLDMTKKTPLTNWAKGQAKAINKSNKRKKKNKIAKSSRKRNRK